MQENEVQERNVHWIKRYEIGLSLYTVILAAVMIGIVLRIYLNGTSPSNLSEDGLYLQPVYSRELVAGYLWSLLPWFLIWGVAVIVGGILHRRMPVRKDFVPASPEETFDRLVRQIMRQSAGQPETGGAETSPRRVRRQDASSVERNASHLDGVLGKSSGLGIWQWVDSFERRSGLNASELLRKYEFTESDETRFAVESVRLEQKKWYYVNLACVFICGICLGAAGSYLLNREHFTSWDLEQVMGAMLRAVLPPLVVAFAVLCARSEWKKKSLERMIPQLRTIAAADAKTRLSKKKVVASENSKEPGLSRLTISRLVIAVVAVIFLVVGVNNGGMRDVLVKAINICTECIGLG